MSQVKVNKTQKETSAKGNRGSMGMYIDLTLQQERDDIPVNDFDKLAEVIEEDFGIKYESEEIARYFDPTLEGEASDIKLFLEHSVGV